MLFMLLCDHNSPVFGGLGELNSQNSHLKMQAMLAGAIRAHAANCAVIHPTLQALEARDIWSTKKPGYITFEAATVAGADILKQMPYIQFGIEGEFHVHLFPDVPRTHPSFTFDLASNSVASANSFTPAVGS